ncbi:Farnesyl pyrophosphate synthetase [Phytophthora palmivora]|uniref:Farnesyl pyrophosphate synthetase n=1 Tax=Phytophthora palmivora TaxID=4796 RepID=A0A2P4YKR8_9STRA|nr:Farnesyl pyrophosphate synthetase [Phytophthora palmivora]
MAQEREEFIAVCGKLKLEVLELLRTKHQLPQEALDWVNEMVEYNCIGGKLNRGISVVHCTQAMAPGKVLTPELKEKASVLGWCIEWLQAFFLVADDIMDESITRRGQPCWYRKPNVKMIAINDAFLLEAFVFQILKKHFRSEPYYLDLVDTFHDVVFHTEIGQLLDLTSQPLDGEVDLDRFTVERYRQIVINKTAYYTFYLSAACAMFLNGVVDEASHGLAKKICKVIGKVGTDIQDNKCSWLVVQALDRATPEQRETLKKNYGRNDPDAIAVVKKLYNELDLATVYHRYEDDTYKILTEEIDQVTVMPSEVFTLLVSKIFKRNK